MKLYAQVCFVCIVGLAASLPQSKRRPVAASPSQDDYPVAAATGKQSEDSSLAASDSYKAYEGGYADEQAKFEKAVQESAAAYNPDYGVQDGRLNFAIHGQQGPNSYRFGYDTGKGQNRVFRFEERDQYGVVHGRYGYYDNTGKLRIVNYSAHPQHGFQAEGNFGPK